MNIVNLIKEIERENMPQIKGYDFLNFLISLKKRNIPYKFIQIDIEKLRFIQDNYSKDKLSKIEQDIEKNKKFTPIIISKANYVADGNHRVLACKKLKIKKMKALKIFTDIHSILQIMNKV